MHIVKMLKFAIFGFVAGACITAAVVGIYPYYADVGVSSEMIASLAGAVVGGAVSIAGTYVFQRGERRKSDLTAAYLLISQVGEMHTDIIGIMSHIKKGLNKAKAHGAPEKAFWTFIVPMLGSYRRGLNPEGLAILIEAREYETHGNLVEFARIHDVLTNGWEEYVLCRRELGRIIPITSVSGGRFASEVSPQEHSEATVRIAELEALLESILESRTIWLQRSYDAASLVGPAFKRHFRVKGSFPGIVTVDGMKPQTREATR